MLAKSVTSGSVTQGFGPSAIHAEPAMYATSEKAYWAEGGKFAPGARYYSDFHPGVDRGADYGTPIQAMEAGVVEFAAYKDSISGNQIEVAINERAGFSINHLSTIRVKVGQHVHKGDVIGNVGTSGYTTGPHTHEAVYLIEMATVGTYSFFRKMLYDPDLFLIGGKYANDDRIKPEEKYFAVNGVGVNIRYTPISFDDRSDVFATSADPPKRKVGIFRRGTGNRIGPIDKVFHFLRWADTPEGTFAVGTAFNRKLAVRKSLMHFVDGP